MTQRDAYTRRRLLEKAGAAGAAVAGGSLLAAAPAAAHRPRRKRRTPIDHLVISCQENRSFDHYFGTLSGVRGFGDRLPLPVPDLPGVAKRSVWYQPAADGSPQVIAPFHLDTLQSFEYMRVEGTPHAWPDAQGAWGDGAMSDWPRYKHNHSMGYFTEQDMPFQFALAEAFTLCDAYHCSFMGNTNPNRLFLWTGTNDPLQKSIEFTVSGKDTMPERGTLILDENTRRVSSFAFSNAREL